MDEDDTDHDAPRNSVGSARMRSRAARGVGAVLFSGAVVAVGLFGYAGYLTIRVAHSYSSGITSMQDAFPDEERRPAQTQATNILLIGVDKACSAGATPLAPQAGQTDSMMLVHLPADRSNVHVVSIMRNLWVPIPGHGFDKIDAAVVLGGAPLAVETVENLLRTRIDHLAIVDLAGLASVVDAVNGIDVRSDRAFASAGFEFVRGANHLDGAEAMRFLREQEAFPDADFARVKNQQAVARGITDRVFSGDAVTDPSHLDTVVDELAPYVTVDSELDWRTAMALGYSLYGARGQHHYFTIPTSGIDTTFGGQSIIRPDDVALAQLRDAFARDDVATLHHVGGG